jgi:hypothetical protein
MVMLWVRVEKPRRVAGALERGRHWLRFNAFTRPRDRVREFVA